MGWVLGLGFLLFRSRFCLPRRAAAHCLAHKSWAVSFVVYLKKTARDRTTLRPRKKKKKQPGTGQPSDGKKNLVHYREPVALVSPYLLRLVIV